MTRVPYSFYRSEDLKNWKFDGELTTEKAFGYMWERPDFFTLEGQEVLSVSPQGLTREEFRFQNIYQSGYFILKDGKPEEKLSGNGTTALISMHPRHSRMERADGS